eukprot:COSAG05_NODE_3035_length_2397_cov_2.703655_2_plen_69_part_00
MRRFEKMIDRKIGGKEGKHGLPGTIPKFIGREMAKDLPDEGTFSCAGQRTARFSAASGPKARDALCNH